MARRHDHNDDDDEDELDARVEALLDLLVAAGSKSTDNNAVLEQFTNLFAEIELDDLPDAAQPLDRGMERLIAILETCRSFDETIDDSNDVEKELSATRRAARAIKTDGDIASAMQQQQQQQQAPKRSSSSRQVKSSNESKQPRQPKQQQQLSKTTSEPQLQDQFDKEYNSNAYPKIGPGYSDTISVVSDLTTPTVMTGFVVGAEERDYHDYYNNKSELNRYRIPSTTTTTQQQHRRRKKTNGAAASRRHKHQVTLGRLGEHSTTMEKIPERKQQQPLKSYPSLKKSPNAFPSVFPTDDLSASLPHSPRRGANKLLLKKSSEAGYTKSRLSSSQSKRSKAIMTSTTRLKKRSSVDSERSRKSSDHNKQSSIDGVLSTMGQDIDYIFRELSALDDEHDNDNNNNNNDKQHQQLDDVSEVSESNLGATAKIKYTLGSVARTLKKDTHESSTPSKLLQKEKDRLQWSQGGGGGEDRSHSSSAGTPKSDPLLIDEDGFLIFGDDPFVQAANVTGHDHHSPSARRSSHKRRTAKRSSSLKKQTSRGSSQETETTAPTTAPGLVREARITNVEQSTRKRIAYLRKLVKEHSGQDDYGSNNNSEALTGKLDFVESETMKQIERLRQRMGQEEGVA